MGAGSNTLIRDGGFDGIIIKLGKSFSHLSLFNQNMLNSGRFSTWIKMFQILHLKIHYQGFEFLSCIPGTIGGGIKMNSGCYGEDISKILISVQAMDLSGKVKSNIFFRYKIFL